MPRHSRSHKRSHSHSHKRSHSRSHKRSHSRVRIPIRKGEMLRKCGYGLDRSPKQRQMALRKASKKYGPLSVFRKLNALAVLNKSKNKSNSKKYLKDRDYVKKMM